MQSDRVERVGERARSRSYAARGVLPALLFVVASALSGCATLTTVSAPLTIPAQIPVRTFPSIWVVGGHFAEDEQLVEALSSHLAEDSEIEVRRVDLAELEPAREAGLIRASTVVLLAEVAMREGVEQYWDSEPVQACSYYSCSTQYQSYVASAPAVTAELVLTVYEGPTARVLQRERFRRSVVGADAESARAEVLAMLTEDALAAVDTVHERVRIELYLVDLPDVKAAVAEIRRGDWARGRELLERAKDHLGGLRPQVQAKVWFDLGMARRFAPGPEGMDEKAYQAARRAFAWAVKLDPKPPHHLALSRLERDFQNQLDLDEQQEARDHNFRAVRASRSDAPEPAEQRAPPAVGAQAPEPPARGAQSASDAQSPPEVAPGASQQPEGASTTKQPEKKPDVPQAPKP